MSLAVKRPLPCAIHPATPPPIHPPANPTNPPSPPLGPRPRSGRHDDAKSQQFGHGERCGHGGGIVCGGAGGGAGGVWGVPVHAGAVGEIGRVRVKYAEGEEPGEGIEGLEGRERMFLQSSTWKRQFVAAIPLGAELRRYWWW